MSVAREGHGDPCWENDTVAGRVGKGVSGGEGVPRAGGIVGCTMTGGDVGYKAGLGELPRLGTVDLI